MRRSLFKKTLVMTLSAVSLGVACDPALAPACTTRRNIERPIGTITPQQPPTPLPAPWPPPSTPQSRLALHEVRTADTRADFAPDFGMNMKGRSKPRPGARRTPGHAKISGVQLEPDSDAKAPAKRMEGKSSTTKVAGASRLAVETLDRLAQSAPLLEDARGKFVRLSSDELFEPGKSALSPLANFTLENIAQALKAQDRCRITVQVYTDSLGSVNEGVALSLRRAKAVRQYLVQFGVPAAQLKAEGLGPANPLADDATAEGRSQNRRVEIVIGDCDPA